MIATIGGLPAASRELGQHLLERLLLAAAPERQHAHGACPFGPFLVVAATR
jgi:hypothetical protein